MESLSDILISLITDKDNFRLVIMAVMVITITYFISPILRRIIEVKGTSIFYSETGRTSEASYQKRIKILEENVKDLRKEISGELLKNASSLIDKELNLYLDNNLEKITNQKLAEEKIFEKEAFKNIEYKIASRLDEYLSNVDDESLLSLYKNKKSNELKVSANEILFQSVEMESKSAGFLKSFMINLFVMVNIGLFILYFFKAGDLNSYAAASLSGLYLSLVGFIIYIFRASNARTSVLLAIKEDYKKQLLALEYVENLSADGELSENDIEFIRMMMINHSEREKKGVYEEYSG